MIKRVLPGLLFTLLVSPLCYAEDLMQVYHQALLSDPVYHKAISDRLATREGFQISASALLPQLAGAYTQASTRVSNVGTVGTHGLSLSLKQTVFDFSKFSSLAISQSNAEASNAVLNAATQDLMIRVSNAYFAVLQNEENLNYANSNKRAYQNQYDQVNQQFKVGLKTITDVYTAKAAYDSASADTIAAKTNLENTKENLRAITGVYYTKLDSLSYRMPLVKPDPDSSESWVNKAIEQNWSIRSARLNSQSARENIRLQTAGHLPTVNVEAGVDKEYSNAANFQRTPSTPYFQTNRSIGVNVNIPIFSGGGVVAKTNQARYQYESAQASLDQTIRTVVNQTRQGYLGVVSSMSQIMADQQTIKSTESSLEGLIAAYKVGTATLVDVINQQSKVFQSQTSYAQDRYAYVNNVLALKQAAGTLSPADLQAINTWLVHGEQKEKKV